MQNIKNHAIAQIGEEILYKEEHHPESGDFESLTCHARQCLISHNLTGFQTDTAMVILHELLESLSGFILNNRILIVLKKITEKALMIKVHLPLPEPGSEMVEKIDESVRKVNMHDDLDVLFMDTMERPRSGEKDTTFRYSLVRKLTKGSLISWNRSAVYVPGMALSVPFPLV
jgi:hypothetical protein